MALEIIAFLLLGIAVGTGAGITPGIHPNMVVLLVPLLATLGLEPSMLLTFLVALGISNIFVDFIPSLLLGAPDSESGLATMPGHRMLMKGKGHHAVRLAVTGGLLSILLCTALLPAIALALPPLYSAARPHTHFILGAIAALLVVSEKSPKKIFWSAACFLLAGSIGLISSSLPVDRSLVLFPVLSGLFGVPGLLLLKSEGRLPDQRFDREGESRRKTAKATVMGTAGGILSGLLPGVGTGAVASLATVDRNDRSFLTTLGAIAAANALVSFLALWLIGNPRSGVAVAAEQLITLDYGLFLLVAAVALASAGIAAPLTLALSRKALKAIAKVSYASFGRALLLLLAFLAGAFTGPVGLLLMASCSALGVFAASIKIRRGILMGVLILPTILFFAGI
jgi:putative membrane protein